MFLAGKLLIDAFAGGSRRNAAGARLGLIALQLASVTRDADKDPSVPPLGPSEAFPGAAVGVGDREGGKEAGGLSGGHGFGLITTVFHSALVGDGCFGSEKMVAGTEKGRDADSRDVGMESGESVSI